MLHIFDKDIPSKGIFSDFSLLKLKLIKFLMSFFKRKVSFSLNFGSMLSVIRDNSSVLFQVKLYMIWIKGAHQSAKFQTFDCSPKFHRICTLIGYLKYIKFQLRSTEELYLMTLKFNAKFDEKLIFCFKNDKNLVKFDLSTRKPPKLALSFAPIVQSM